MKTKDITVNAMLMAITAIMAVVPQLGMIDLGFTTVTIMHLPVIVAGIVLGMRSALLNGFVFGVCSLLIAATRAVHPFSLLFINPLVSILPRLIFAMSVAWVMKWAQKVKFLSNFATSAVVAAVVSTLVHTFAVLTAAYFAIRFSGDAALASYPTAFIAFLLSFLVINVFFEVLVSVFIGVPASLAIRKVRRP